MRYAFVFLAIMTLCACGTMVKSPEQIKFRESMASWVGRPVDDLVATNGPPADIFPLDSGGRVFEYVHRQAKKEAKQANVETKTIIKNDGRVRTVRVQTNRDWSRLREREGLTETAPEVPTSEGDLSWQMDHTQEYAQYSHREIPLGCNILFNVSAGNIIERWSMEGEQCD